MTSALNGILAQRLLRCVCPHCATEHKPGAAELRALGLDGEDLGQHTLRRGVGCGDCRGTGYKGRRAILEILLLNDAMRRMIAEQRPVAEIKEEARRTGTRFLREAALDLARRGETSIEEVARVTLQA